MKQEPITFSQLNSLQRKIKQCLQNYLNDNPQKPDIFTTFKLKHSYPKTFSTVPQASSLQKAMLILNFQTKALKGKGAHEPNAQTARAYPGFISMKHLGVLLLPPGQDASPSQGYPAAECRRYPLIHVGEKRQSGVKFLYATGEA